MAKTKTSLKGIAHYPHLNTPDTRFDADGSYHVKLRMDSEDPKVAEYLEWLDAEHEVAKKEMYEALINPEAAKPLSAAAAKKKVKDGDKPYVYVEDEDGEPTNEVLINFKMKAHVTSKKTGKSFDLKPKFFDAKGQLLKNPPLVYSGSTLRVSYTPLRWFTPKLGASIRLRMEAIQIIDLVTGGGSNNAGDYGFGEEEGYEGEDEAFTDAPASQVTAETAGGDDDNDDEDF